MKKNIKANTKKTQKIFSNFLKNNFVDKKDSLNILKINNCVENANFDEDEEIDMILKELNFEDDYECE